MKKNNKKKFKKILLFLVLVVVLIGGYVGYKNNNTSIDNTNKKVSQKELDKFKFVRIKYLIMKKNDSDYSLKDAFPDHFEDYLSYASEYLLLSKGEDYYTINIKNQANEVILNSITDYAFAMNNNYAQMIDDCIFDKEKFLIKIPSKYFKETYENIERKNGPIQIEFLTRLSTKELKNLNINIDSKKIFVKNNIIERDGTKTDFSINGLKKYKKNDIEVYLNNSNTKLNNNYYDYNSKTGRIDFNINPIFVSNLKIEYKNNISGILGVLFNIDKISATVSSNQIKGSFDTIPIFTTTTKPNVNPNGKMEYYYANNGAINTMIPINVITDNNFDNSEAFIYSNKELIGGDLRNLYPYENNSTNAAANNAAAWDALQESNFGNRTSSSTEIHDVISITLENLRNYTGINVSNDDIDGGLTTKDNGGKDNIYLGVNCVHITNTINSSNLVSSGHNGATVHFLWKISDVVDSSDGYTYYTMILMLNHYGYYWSGTGTNNVVQTILSVVKFRYKDDNTKLKVIKKSTDENGTTQPEGVKIALYSDNTCSTKIKEGTTNSSGEVLFDGLKVNTNYYINELDVNEYKWVTSGCKNVYVEKDDSNKVTEGTENYYYKEVQYLNRAKRYCIKVKKVDAENPNSTTINGIEFNLTNGSNISINGTTTGNGIYTYNYLIKNTNGSSTGYRLHEKSADGTKGYWNDGLKLDNNGDAWINDSDLTEMVYTLNGVPASESIFSAEPGGSYLCPSDAFTYTKSDHKQYYCVKVKKVDKNTKELIKPATFKNITTNETHSDGWDGKEDGYTTFFTSNRSGLFKVKETIAPQGYAVYPSEFDATAFILPRELDSSEAETECKKVTCTYDIANDKDTCRYTPGNSETDKTNGDVIENIKIGTIPSFPDSKLLLNWFKEFETNGSKANSATFKVKNSDGKYITVSGTETIADASEPVKTKTCYKYSGLSNTMAGGSTLTSGANGAAGEVCITGVDEGTYTVIETSPAPNHTFSSGLTKDITASTKFNDNQVFKNYGTYIEVEKKVTDSNRVSNALDSTILSRVETNKLKKIPFEVYSLDGNGNVTGDPINFVLRDGIYYDLSSPDINLNAGETSTTSIYLNDSRRFKLSHLAWGKYIVKEKGHKDSGTCVCEDESECIGYYYPKSDQEIKFEITKCSSSNSVSSATANDTIGANTCSITYTSLAGYQDNTPTELWFTKKDFYSYESSDDVQDEEVDFVDDKERSDFDKIVFKVKDSNGNYLKFIDIGAHITDSNKVCLNDNDYREYRYITDEELNLLTAEERAKLTIVTDLHTCGGHIRVTNLCRGKSYTVEEVSVPENSVFILPEKQEDRETIYKVPCCEDTTTTIKTTTTIIRDKGTRVTFEKRDSKYGYLIPDETTTFQVYRCKKDTECHPADGITSDMKLMKFAPRSTITDDEEDYGKEVYNAMSDSDVSGGKEFVTDLHPYKGDLILRYLQSGYNYVLLETVAPLNYALPKGRNAETRFTVLNTTVNVEEIDVPNKPTSLLIRKYDEKGNLLPGAEFRIYKVTSYDENRTPENQEKQMLKLKTIRDGLYDAREKTDTDSVKTCKDNALQKCSEINPTLTYDSFISTWTNFNNSVNQNKERVEIKEGEALIQYLEYNNYYVIEEIKAPDGYSLPEKTEDRFTIVHIVPESDVVDTEKEFINKPTAFKFYKFDEYDRLIDGAKFKLQKLDDNKKYHDLTVTREETEKDVYYKVDENTTNTIIETKGGSATVYYLEEGQYRILEVEAPSGYELPKKTINVATFFVDSVGNVYGNSIITNKKPTETITGTLPASAELIVNVQTGQERIKYGIIIGGILLIISGLIYIQRKRKK